MTTNQTIDGVPRELLENAARCIERYQFGTDWARKLRALLDTPVPTSSAIGHIEQRRSMGLTIGSPITNVIWELPHPELQHLPDGAKVYLHPAAQPQGEPVAYLDIGAGGYVDLGTDQPIEALEKLPYGRHALGIIGTYGADGWKSSVKPPASEEESRPVAYAVFADNGSIRLWSRSLAVVEMISGSGLNPVPLYAEQPAPDIKLHVNVSNVKVTVNADGRYSIDPVAAAQTCCGSCPGGCVYGLKA